MSNMEASHKTCVFLFIMKFALTKGNLPASCSLHCHRGKQILSQRTEVYLSECSEQKPEKLAGPNQRLNLTVNPYFVSNRTLVSAGCWKSQEYRWTPGLNITWYTQHDLHTYEVKIHHLPLRPIPTIRSFPTESTCVRAVVFDAEPMRCEYTCGRIDSPSVLVRVSYNISESISLSYDEAMINFHRRFLDDSYGKVYQGLSLFYKRPLVPSSIIEELIPNPRFWTTILKVRNDSAQQEVSVMFDVAPYSVKMANYRVDLMTFDAALHERGSSVRNITYILRSMNAMIGSVNFENVTAGLYFVRVQPFSEDGDGVSQYKCWTKYKDQLRLLNSYPCNRDASPSASCPHVDSGLFLITEHPILNAPSQVPQTTRVGASLDVGPTSKTALITFIFVSIFAALTLLIVVIIVMKQLKNRKSGQVWIFFGKQRRALPKPQDTMSNVIKVFLVYSRDNVYHLTVVSKFCQLLREVGNCEVTVDLEDGLMGSYSPLDWVENKLGDADKVVFIKSEGALERMNLSDDLCFTKLENENKGSIFSASVRAMGTESMHRQRGKLMAVSFSYSNQRQLSESRLINIVSKSNHFNLMEEINSFLLALRDLSQCKHGLFRTVITGQEETLSHTEVYKQLQEAIENAARYHIENPAWFRYTAEKRVQPETRRLSLSISQEEGEPCQLPLTIYPDHHPFNLSHYALIGPSLDDFNQGFSDIYKGDPESQLDLTEQIETGLLDKMDWTCTEKGHLEMALGNENTVDAANSELSFSTENMKNPSSDYHYFHPPESLSSSCIEGLDLQDQQFFLDGVITPQTPHNTEVPNSDHIEIIQFHYNSHISQDSGVPESLQSFTLH